MGDVVVTITDEKKLSSPVVMGNHDILDMASRLPVRIIVAELEILETFLKS